ncbi:hypothetical protein M422DRAFT_263422 [Sphaerobolus stellatus SS14]|uniref:Uncharacterized protein n=1 Tax=Sphaerobolus stellatus (strain SS14) TaxID=990650 RepID=A0A0C9UHY1_SPHS4|nr:hypothetical protein M422DRAFT_263422 [Sphaerobolus stellatus SS14]
MLGFKDASGNTGAGSLSTLELRAFVLGGAPTDEVPRSRTPAESAVNKDMQRCNRCHKWLPLELFPALIKQLRPNTWKPRTKWEGCKVFEEKEYDFFFVKYLIRD